MAAVIKLKGPDSLNPIRVAGTAEKDPASQRIIARDGNRVTGEFPLEQVDVWYNEPGDVAHGEDSRALRDDERLRLTWSFAWPALLFDLFYTLVRAPQGWEFSPKWIDLAVAVFSFFVISTWAIRRTIGLHYDGFQLVIIRPGRPSGRNLSYAESLSVAWLVAWRTCVILVPLLLPIALAAAMLGRPDWERSAPGWVITMLADLVVAYLWAVPCAIRKQYAGFSCSCSDRNFNSPLTVAGRTIEKSRRRVDWKDGFLCPYTPSWAAS